MNFIDLSKTHVPRRYQLQGKEQNFAGVAQPKNRSEQISIEAFWKDNKQVCCKNLTLEINSEVLVLLGLLAPFLLAKVSFKTYLLFGFEFASKCFFLNFITKTRWPLKNREDFFNCSDFICAEFA